MEQKPIDLEQAVRDIAYLVRQYGYRNRFTITIPESGTPKFTGNLNDCLNRYLAANIQSETYPLFELHTNASYNPSIGCRFKLEFDRREGFRVHTMWVKDLKGNIEHEFRLRNNKELPGAQTLGGLFPKPKPWDFLKKGKFRL